MLAPHYTSFLLRLASDSVPLQQDKIRLLLNLLNADDELVESIWLGILREFIACVENVGDDGVIKEAVGGVGELARRVGFGVTTKGAVPAGTVREDVIKICVTALMDMIGSPYGKASSESLFYNFLTLLNLSRHRGVECCTGSPATSPAAAFPLDLGALPTSTTNPAYHYCPARETVRRYQAR